MGPWELAGHSIAPSGHIKIIWQRVGSSHMEDFEHHWVTTNLGTQRR